MWRVGEAQPIQTAADDERLKGEFPPITLPLPILHGRADKATKFSGSQLFYEKAGSPDSRDDLDVFARCACARLRT